MKSSMIIARVLILFILFSCDDKDETPPQLPELTTNQVTEITIESAKSGGNIVSDGGSAVTTRGVCWSTNATPTVVDNKTNDGSGGGPFTSLITGLNESTSYFVRAYATTFNGTAYGLTYSFTTGTGEISITTSNVVSIKDKSVTSGGTIISDGGSSIASRGVCWSTGVTPSIVDSKTIDGSGLGTLKVLLRD